MTEKQLIAKIERLRQIKPDSNWASLTKSQILGESDRVTFAKVTRSLFAEIMRGERFVLGHKLAFATLTVFVVFVGVFGFAQSSMPGDSLFKLKKITEQSQAVFIAEKDQPSHNLALANKRLDDLTKIAENNKVDSLAVAINEYKESVAKVAGDLANGGNSDILNKLVELGQKEEQVKSLGVEVGENEELNTELAKIVERMVLDMENRELTEEEAELLNNIKFEYEQGNYSKALEILLLK
ncbi:MAG: hypothetical protein KKG75_04820 [Nanoarchaeota archaeon]|nr:hypothetical protein [Nanoarchaeota archaeon]